MTEILFLIEEDPDVGFTARAAGESIVTQADDMTPLREAVRDAVVCHFPDRECPKIARFYQKAGIKKGEKACI